MILYTLDNKFTEETHLFPDNFTGILKNGFGTKIWYLNGKFHRIDGPAVVWPDGTKAWYINGRHVSQREHDLYVDTMKLKGLL